MEKRCSLLMLLIVLCAVPVSAGSDREFDAHWHDGKAEINGYQLTVSRYGQDRDGTAVLIYVTEPFSKSKNVKVDNWRSNPDDTYNVLKLNLVRDFQTGIYDYNTMVSVFSRTDDFAPVKVTFSSAEWCGNVYEELVVGPRDIKGHFHSYFEGESGTHDIARVAGGVLEDNLFILLRGLRGEYLEAGGRSEVELLPSVYFGRLAHKPPRWIDAEIEREKKTRNIKVPAGKFRTIVYNVETDDGRKGTFYIEESFPHRVVRWDMLPDVKAELTGSERLQYWSLNRNGNESYLEKLGLEGQR